jgi:PAS domain S-box-containing protein
LKAVSWTLNTIMEPIEQLNLATVIEVSQAVLGENVLEKLLDTIVRIAIVQAGAQRALLIIVRGDKYRIEAEATTNSENVNVDLRHANVTSAEVPESVFHYVLRTKESLRLDDALSERPFFDDEYIKRHSARSILCLPLLKQNRLIGVLYFENNLSCRVFTSARMAILKLLALEAACSIENTLLYGELREREARVRRLVDSNIIGIFIGRSGCITEANDAFLQIVGYSRDDLLSGCMRWPDMTPPEWRKEQARAVAELRATGTVKPFENAFLRRDGSRVPVLIGGAMFDECQGQGVAFVLDLTERKQAEDDLRRSERRYHEAELELAHANRVATLGQLSTSLAHEVKQPIAAAINNASAALHWIDRESPDLEKIRQSLGRIVGNGHRANDVISRIRSLLKKAPLQKERFQINDAIREVLALSGGEITKNAISVRTQLAAGLLPIEGDRVQLQQVILNLVINAVEAMSSVTVGPRELTISTVKGRAESVHVAIRDSGPGMAQVALDRAFDAFYTTKPGGLGMGLSISRSIIEAHGGRLWATVKAPQGASFEFTLPAARDVEQRD